MIVNPLRARLRAGEAVRGCFVRSPDPDLAEFVAAAGWDFLVFDGEHGRIASTDVADLARAAEVRGVSPIARVPRNEPSTILRFLDAGVHGIHVPWVNTPDEARQVIEAAKYRPEGFRGLAGNRSIDWRVTPETVTQANAETMVIIHIETADAVEEIDGFLEVAGIDVLFVGPTDLSHSLGHPGRRDHPEVVAAIERVAQAVVDSPVAFGIYAGDSATARRWIERGARYVTTGIESLLGPAMGEYLERT